MTTPALEFKDVRKSYGTVEALRGVNLSVPSGSLFGLVGPNGAGKTTLFSIACGFLAADAGQVRVVGHESAGRMLPKGTLSILPQDAAFMPNVQVEQQLAYYAELGGMERAEAAREAQRVLELVQLSDVRTRAADAMSHGQRKRVGIAQAFLGDPKVIILDEPTAGLDPQVSREIRSVLRSIRKSQTVVVSSHNLLEIEDLCDEVAILSKGAVVRQDKLEGVVGEAAEVAFRMSDDPGEALRAAVQQLDFNPQVHWDKEASRLRVAFDPARKPAAEAARDLVVFLVDRKVPFLEMQLGRSLEDRYLDETK